MEKWLPFAVLAAIFIAVRDFISKDIKINNHNEIKSLGEIKESNELDDILNALILGTKDYAWKNGFEKCLVSLSGGIDSALVTYIAVMAVGKEYVKVVTLPSKYSSSPKVPCSLPLPDILNPPKGAG